MRLIEPIVLRKAVKVGTTVESVDLKSFLSIPVSIPEIEEQRRIAEILDAADEAIAAGTAALDKLRNIKAGLLNDLLTRGLDASGNLRAPERQPELFKLSPLGLIPNDWEVAFLDQEIKILHGFAFSGKLFSETPPGEVLLVPGNFHREGGLYFDKNNTKYFQGEYLESTVLSNGDLLTVMTDLSPRTLILGRVVELQTPFKVLHNQRIGKIVIKNPKDWISRFVLRAMNNEILRRKIINTATGTTVRHTSPERILKNYIVKPDIKEQEKIVEILDCHDALIRAEEDELEKLKQLKKGLMYDLLTGAKRCVI